MNPYYVKHSRKQIGKGYPGERHVPLIVNGRLRQASYMGPGTNLITRLKNNDKPLTFADKTAQLHDIRYGLSSTAEQIRDADIEMLNNLDKIQKRGLDNKININLGRVGIKAKTLGEDIGILNKGSFGGLDKKKVYSNQDRKLLEDNMLFLKQKFQGMGYNRGLGYK